MHVDADGSGNLTYPPHVTHRWDAKEARDAKEKLDALEVNVHVMCMYVRM